MGSKNRDDLLNVVDLEATCWPISAPEDQVSEIIEIGLCVVDTDTRQRVQRDRVLVRPEHSRVSEFCINAKEVFADLHARRPVGMSRALTMVGIPREWRHHSGVDDAWNTAALVLHIMENGSWPRVRRPATR